MPVSTTWKKLTVCPPTANRLNPSNPQYQPCNAGDPVSMCCHIADECRSDGLCHSTWFDGNVWRDFCTDKTWEDPACIKLCVTGTSTSFPSLPVTLHQATKEECRKLTRGGNHSGKILRQQSPPTRGHFPHCNPLRRRLLLLRQRHQGRQLLRQQQWLLH